MEARIGEAELARIAVIVNDNHMCLFSLVNAALCDVFCFVSPDTV
jgi:hypothetical protein